MLTVERRFQQLCTFFHPYKTTSS